MAEIYTYFNTIMELQQYVSDQGWMTEWMLFLNTRGIVSPWMMDIDKANYLFHEFCLITSKPLPMPLPTPTPPAPTPPAPTPPAPTPPAPTPPAPTPPAPTPPASGGEGALFILLGGAFLLGNMKKKRKVKR